jgi:ferrous iron transport protein B
VVDILLDKDNEHFPDKVIYVADATNLERHTLLATQLIDLGIPVFYVLNMIDLSDQVQVEDQLKALKSYLKCPVMGVSSRNGSNIPELKEALAKWIRDESKPTKIEPLYPLSTIEREVVKKLDALTGPLGSYKSLMIAHHYSWLSFIKEDQRTAIQSEIDKLGFKSLELQIHETLDRYDQMEAKLKTEKFNVGEQKLSLTQKIDAIVTHSAFGLLIFFGIMFFVFQAIYWFAEYPMQWIEELFVFSGEQFRGILGTGWFSDLFIDGILAGLSGVLVFIPQIAILFLLISLLEEVGYMSRAVYMFDHVMKKFGLNGRSIVSLISSGACAIPAIMSTRTISNWKERIITIMVSPLISCSARIPVYTILIGFAVPNKLVWGMFNLQGIAFMGLYALGIIMALVSALVFKYVLKSKERSYLMIELPTYRSPIWRNVFLTIREKVGAFISEAGKVILIISVVLWFLSSYSFPGRMLEAENQAIAAAEARNLNEKETENLILSLKVEHSFAGIIGKTIEPAIAPLGFDWKMGIALVTSFAAREVFVGTMATIYSVGSVDDELTLRKRMAAEINPATGEKVYNVATSFSLLIFYVFAMQCMSTLAITKKETNSWKWPLVQFTYMSVLAYLGSFITFNLFS